MAGETKRGRAQDRAKVAGGQKYEVAYEAKKTGVFSDSGEGGSQDGRQLPPQGRSRVEGQEVVGTAAR